MTSQFPFEEHSTEAFMHLTSPSTQSGTLGYDTWRPRKVSVRYLHAYGVPYKHCTTTYRNTRKLTEELRITNLLSRRLLMQPREGRRITQHLETIDEELGLMTVSMQELARMRENVLSVVSLHAHPHIQNDLALIAAACQRQYVASENHVRQAHKWRGKLDYR